MTALALAAVGALRWETSVALAADHLLALVLASKSSKRGLNLDDTHATATETEHKMEGGLLLNVVVRKSAAILELLAGEDQTLLIGGNALLVLDLGPNQTLSVSKHSKVSTVSLDARWYLYLLDVINGV